MRPTTLSLFNKAGIEKGFFCLDVGCGGGDVSFELAKIVGNTGRVVGIDLDKTKIELARQEAAHLQLPNVEFEIGDITKTTGHPEFDVTYARFLLTHLNHPEDALKAMINRTKSGGTVIVEDVDFRGHFCYPENEAFGKYLDLYTAVVLKNGGNPNIGPQLPSMMMDAGLEGIQTQVVQPAGISGEVKLMAALTMENIAHAVLSAQLASREEMDRIIAELYDLSRDNHTFSSLPRIVQVWCKVKM
jgi:ubiquinone/menaquinone biosynthesis C-methylase UbiE